jgi:hypothetical protein
MNHIEIDLVAQVGFLGLLFGSQRLAKRWRITLRVRDLYWSYVCLYGGMAIIALASWRGTHSWDQIFAIALVVYAVGSIPWIVRSHHRELRWAEEIT